VRTEQTVASRIGVVIVTELFESPPPPDDEVVEKLANFALPTHAVSAIEHSTVSLFTPTPIKRMYAGKYNRLFVGHEPRLMVGTRSALPWAPLARRSEP
jgi:hypothetical protein